MAEKFSALDISYIDKMMKDFPFVTRDESIELMQMSKVKSKRDEYVKEIIPLVSLNAIRSITVLFHSVMNGYENELYNALSAYLNTGEVKEYPDSLLLQHLLNKAVKIVESDKQFNSLT